MKVKKVGKIWGKILEKKSNAVDDAYARSARRMIKTLIPICGDLCVTTGELVVEMGKACFELEKASDLDKELRKAFPTHRERKKAAKKAAKKAEKAAKKAEAKAHTEEVANHREEALDVAVDIMVQNDQLLNELVEENERLRRLIRGEEE